MMLLIYPSKKELKTQIGQTLRYEETSMFGDEYLANGTFVGANRPHLTGMGREFFAEVTMENGFIKSVQ
jgi:hypothetical protein